MAKKLKKKSPVKKLRKKVEGKFVEVEAKLPLTDAIARDRGKVAWQKLQQRDELILERKSVANEYKARIDALHAEATKLLQEAGEGRELRTVKAREIRNFGQNKVEYHYKGEIIHVRHMTLADKQDELPLKDKNAPLPKVSAIVTPVDAKAEPTMAVTRAYFEHPSASVTPISSAAVKGKSETAGKTMKYDPVAEAHAKDAQATREDVASVIREETNVKSKWSPVDHVTS